MRGKTQTAVRWLALVVVPVLLVACAGTGEVVNLSLEALPPEAGASRMQQQAEPVTVVVRSFEDERPEKDRLGVRTHLGNGETVFESQGDLGREIASVVSEYGRERGWETVLESSQGQTSTSTPAPDAVLSGRILKFSADAESRFMSTRMTAKVRVALKVQNTIDGTVTGLHMDGAREDAVFWFDPEDLERLVNEMLRDSAKSALSHLRYKDGALRVN